MGVDTRRQHGNFIDGRMSPRRRRVLPTTSPCTDKAWTAIVRRAGDVRAVVEAVAQAFHDGFWRSTVRARFTSLFGVSRAPASAARPAPRPHGTP